MSSETTSKKRSEAILGRLLESYLPDERTKLIKKRAKKSTANRKSRKTLRERQAVLKETMDPKIVKEKNRATRKQNIETLASWETEREIDDIKDRVIKMRKEKTARKSPSNLYASSNSEYFEKAVPSSSSKTKSWPGLTPGLAPVDYESDSE